jgi:site-specific DNA-adenine methylase
MTKEAKSLEKELRVFIPYFGGKFMRSPHYPTPKYQTIIEPFAGAAGYSVRHHFGRKVILIDKSEYIAGVWSFLIKASASEILALPLMSPGDDVADLDVPQEAKWLLGFWVNQGSSVPKRTMGGRASNRRFGTWGEPARSRLAEQVEYIRGWRIIKGDYTLAPDCEATWFIDPPYFDQGKQYPHTITDYEALASWCKSRQGQVMVCESEGATWLPFKPVTTVVGSSHRKTTEVLWQNKMEASK